MKRLPAGLMFAFSIFCGVAPWSAGARTLVDPPAIARDPWTPPPTDTLVLVTIDGVRWQEIFQGVDPARAPQAEVVGASELLPHLSSFYEEGTVIGDPRVGSTIAASGPKYVSLPGYVEMISGERGGCADNQCTPRSTWTLAEEIDRRAGGSAAVFSSWDRIGAALPPQGMVVRAGRGAGDATDPSPGCGTYRPDRFTAAAALAYLVQARPRFLWVALGDTDEWAHRNDYASYLRSLRAADAFVGELTATLESMGSYGKGAAIFVTTDHGRDENFADHGGAASANVWLMARGAGVPRRGSVATSGPRYLRDLAPTMATLVGSEARACLSCGRPIRELF